MSDDGEQKPAGALTDRHQRSSRGIFSEEPPAIVRVTEAELRACNRRELLKYGLGGAAVAALGGYATFGLSKPRRSKLLAGILTFDDDVAKAMYSPERLVPTYTKSEVTNLRVTYFGGAPDPSYIPGWRLTLRGLRSGRAETLTIDDLRRQFIIRDQITRLVCVDGWSAIAWWSGLRFNELLHAYPPTDNAKWAKLESSVSTDGMGHSDPYFVSIDLPTARHAQTILATQRNGLPLTVEHGAPLRLVAPMKLGLKNIKAITEITYSVEEPQDFWGNLGFSHYDGI